MRIVIETPDAGEEESVLIRCRKVTPALSALLAELKNPKALVGMRGTEIHRVYPGDVYYCEVVDDKTFLYLKDMVLESKKRLYELEDALQISFLRISKSVLVNIQAIQMIRPALGGRFEAVLDNGETVVISRQYVAAIKEKFGI